MNNLSASARVAVLECLRALAMAGDLGGDTIFVRSVSQRPELTSPQAVACRKILARHPGLLPPDLLAAALSDEPDPPPVVARRLPGRPRASEGALTPAERSRRRRAAGRTGVIEMPAELAERFRAVRDARGETAAATMEAALDALESPG